MNTFISGDKTLSIGERWMFDIGIKMIVEIIGVGKAKKSFGKGNYPRVRCVQRFDPHNLPNYWAVGSEHDTTIGEVTGWTKLEGQEAPV